MVDTDVKGKWRLCVSSSFAAAHALRHYEGNCERVHGHNFEVQAVIEGRRLLENVEILLDFKVLRKLLAEALAPLDHRLLNELAPFDAMNPSSENLARHIALQLGRLLAESPVAAAGTRLVSVTVSEKPGQSASWIMAD